ncbi:MAG: FimV/HubP family polar landmark protein [Lysobacter sp.]
MALALASGAACALGLGQIEVKSRSGQPLLAEIPVISSGPEELAQLRAGLASPETFRRIGLEAPQGIVTDLRFTLALDAAGKPVIRVTSTQPVNQPLLTFLIEVDWGQGRLTREYSALLDAPRTVSAPMQPPIQAPKGAAPNTIERPLEAPLPFGAQPQEADPLSVENQLDRYDPGSAVPAPTPYPPDAIAAQPEQSAAEPVPVEPAPRPQARPNAGTIPRAPREPRAVANRPPAEGDITVVHGQTLSGIAADMAGEHTLNQTMIALLRANPEAFIGNNINRLRAGAVLRLPPSNQLTAIDAREASELVRVQIQQWRQGVASPAVPQPLSLNSDRVAKAPVAPAAKDGSGRSSDARLEIVPPGASRATQAGAQSGISAGGEGEMVRQEMQQANETIAARDQELTELKSKVAELEKLQKDQQKLIALKDSELATSQQHLAEQQSRVGDASPLPWIFGGLGVLALLVGGWVLSRREPKRPAFRAPVGPASEPASAAFDASAQDPLEALRRRPETALPLIDPVAQLLGETDSENAGKPESEPLEAPFWSAPAAEAKPRKSVPPWHAAEAGPASVRRSEPPVAALPEAVVPPLLASSMAASPAMVAPMVKVEPVVASVAAAAKPLEPVEATGAVEPSEGDRVVVPAAPVEAPRATAPAEPRRSAPAKPNPSPGQERIELARAYLDLGDESSARQLLGEVLINGDHAARQQAARLLRELEASS